MILTSHDVRDHNDFSNPNRIVPKREMIEKKANTITYVAPRHSINRFIFTLT